VKGIGGADGGAERASGSGGTSTRGGSHDDAVNGSFADSTDTGARIAVSFSRGVAAAGLAGARCDAGATAAACAGA
jgi:hypothetical protein